MGGVSSFLSFLFIKEPKRGVFDGGLADDRVKKRTGAGMLQMYKEAFKEFFSNNCVRWIIVGGCLRFWAGYTIGNFAPKYFNIYPE